MQAKLDPVCGLGLVNLDYSRYRRDRCVGFRVVSFVDMNTSIKWISAMGARPSSGLVSGQKSAFTFCAIAAASMLLAACSSGPGSPSKGKYDPKYGVSASARVANKRSDFRKGGGHYKVGRPYKVAGRTYVPKHQPNYNKTGRASWYGDDFHGRLTANGEIFDMHDLTAAHPTLPLPSYARVTNLKNGRSVIVRINDRGPYAHNRIIDLSKRVAEVLDFKRDGIANVRVKYVGKARMDGKDRTYLEASYRGPGQRIGDDRKSLPANGSERDAPQRIMVASAKPQQKTKKRGNYLLAHLPPLGSKASAPSPVELSAPAPAGSWAPIDLVGDGAVLPSKGDLPPLVELAPIQLNYAAIESRIAAGHAAINAIVSQPDQRAMSEILSREAAGYVKHHTGSHAVSLSEPIKLGVFKPAYAKRLAEEFAQLSAVDMVALDDGRVLLRLTALKSGAGVGDIDLLRQSFGLPRG